MNEILKWQSVTDSLTGLVNRREMIHRASSIWRICRRNSFWVSIIMIDLDHFKKVNDIHGHAAGDAVLKSVGGILNRFFKRALDCACRYGGEELLVIAGEMSPAEAAARIDVIREELAAVTYEGKNGEPFHVQFSCGIYGEIPVENVRKRLTKITGIADSYLYEAKKSGRNCTFLSDHPKKMPEKFIL
jgi:diguanylate cyclase (GGDEF)-like protein